MQVMISFNLFVRVFVITLYPTLHRLMGQNCDISGCFTLGIRTKSVSFSPFGSKPVSRKFRTNSQRNGAILKSVFFTSSLEKGL